MLKDKVAIITGGSRGIGLETARLFLQNRAKVVIFASKQETVKQAVDALQKENKNYEISGFYPDLTNEKEIKEVFQKIANKYGKIDILINNAGISSRTPIDKFEVEEYEKIESINIKSIFICSKNCIPYLEKTSGVILNTSSMVSIYGQPSGFMYPASKFAVNGITKSLARELAARHIRVNAVAPGIIETDMVKKLPEEMIAPLIKQIPLGRIGKPIDIANAFLFLASDMATYITGIVLSVDGCARS